MDDDQTCKNLLCEKVCECCINEEDDFVILNTKEFPYPIPELHRLLLVEKVINGMVIPICVYIKSDEILIKANDFNMGAKYILHFRYPKCLVTDELIPHEMTCEQFKPIK